jgi:hypothetical protein
MIRIEKQEEIARQIAGIAKEHVPARVEFDEIRILFVPTNGETKTYCFVAAEILPVECE